MLIIDDGSLVPRSDRSRVRDDTRIRRLDRGRFQDAEKIRRVIPTVIAQVRVIQEQWERPLTAAHRGILLFV